MIGDAEMREEFDAFVLRWTGHDVEYHQRNKTGGMEFAWECWRHSATTTQIRAINQQFPSINGAQ